MSGAVSGLNQAAAMQRAQTIQSAQGAIAKKRQEATEAVGQSVVNLLEQAAQMGQQLGQRVDIRA